MHSKKNFITFGSPLIEQEEIDEVVDSLKSGWLGTGPKVAKFEEAFKIYKAVEFAAAVNSCTAALHLSILAADIKPGDEVITTPMTFCATINAIIHSGAIPVLADVDAETMNIDPAQVEAKITSKTRAILLVHFAGRPCDMDALMSLAQKNDLKVIEDCAHAIEATYQGKPTGTFGDFGCFSFYATKNIVTGEGGMVLAKRREDIDRIKILALHGMSQDAWQRFSDKGYKQYFITDIGFKYNMMDLQAAIGIHQLRRIEKYWQRRREIWERYTQAFADLPIKIPATVDSDIRHAYHLFTILIDETRSAISRNNFLNAISKEKIGTGVHYLSIPEHPYYRKNFGWEPEDYPNAMRIGRQTVSLPLSAKLTDDEVSTVINSTKRLLEECVMKKVMQ